MQYRIAICDDEEYFRKELEEHIRKYAGENSVGVRIVPFAKGEELIAELKRAVFDILFLDIEMKGMDGIEAAEKIRQDNKDIVIIFVTSYEGYTFQATKVESFSYLMKPLEIERFHRVMRNAFVMIAGLEEKKRDLGRSLELRVDYELMKIRTVDIIYMEKIRNKIRIWRRNARPVECYDTIKSIIGRLPRNYFYQVNSGVIVNLMYVRKVKAYQVTIQVGKDEIVENIGRGVYRELNRAFLNYQVRREEMLAGK